MGRSLLPPPVGPITLAGRGLPGALGQILGWRVLCKGGLQVTLGTRSPGLLALLHRQFQGLQLERDACLASNYALAKENLALRPRLEMGRTALAIKYQELREVAENCADKLQRLGEGRPRRPAWGGVGLDLCQVLMGGAGTHPLLDRV